MNNKINYFLALCFIGLTLSSFAKRGKPNILFIFSDDQTFETIGINGQEKVKTPNLDRLTKQGVTFTHTYNMGAFGPAVCVASRVMLNSGGHLWKASNVLRKCMNGEKKSWSTLMSDAGYETYMTGKWHIPLSAPEVFDHTINVRLGMPKQTPKGYNRPVEGEDPANAWYPWDKKNGGFWQGGKHWSEVLADDGVNYIEQAAKEEKPFFMYMAFNAPHDPRQAPKEYVDMYPLDQIDLPKNYQAQYPDMNPQAVPKVRDENLAPFPRTEYAIKVHRQEYYASITYMDKQIGRILDALEKSGKADNTWIIFTSDHGLAVGRHGLVGKQNMYEHSMRAPFIICGPKLKKNKKIDTPIYIQDAMATSLEIAGIEKPDYVDFKSVLPLIEDSNQKSYEAIYGAYMGTQRMVMKNDWKLIVYPKLKKYKLFDLSKDSFEMNDLSKNTKYAEKFEEMKQLLEHMMDEQEDPMRSIEEANFNYRPISNRVKGKKANH